MRKLFSLLFLLTFASSASASIYRWVDQGGTINFADDYSKVPPAYHDSVQEIKVPKTQRAIPTQVSAEQSRQAPPISQTLVREGDFAIDLAESLRLGRASNEAEAESLLASVGISPKNGWIADYPVTPDIIGELHDSIDAAVDLGKLAMSKDAAMKALQDLNVQQGLPVSAVSGNQGPEAEPVQSDGEYSNPEVINNYYYEQGPPVVTYYPPPPDYGYLYSWVPYPFWCSGFWFSGYYILNDFHRFAHDHHHGHHGREEVISNHTLDPRTRKVFSVDPRTRNITGRPHGGTGGSYAKRPTYPRTQMAVSPIRERSQQLRSRNPVAIGARSVSGRQFSPNTTSNPYTFRGRAETVRPSPAGQGMSRSQIGISSHSFGSSGGRTTVPRSGTSRGGGSFGGIRGSGGLGGGNLSGGSGRR